MSEQGAKVDKATRKPTLAKAAKPKRAPDDAAAAKRPKTDVKAAGKQDVEEEDVESTNVKGYLAKDLQVMMYGFGDDVAPLPETVDLVEDIVLEYTTALLARALEGASGRAKARAGMRGGVATALGPEDILFLVRKDARKFSRVQELLSMQEEIKKAKSIVDVSPEEMAKLVD